MSPAPSATARSGPRARSALVALATLALVAAVTLVSPTAASSQDLPPIASVDPVEGPLYANGLATFTGTCPRGLLRADGPDEWLDMVLTFSGSDVEHPYRAALDGTTWVGETGFLGDVDAEQVTVAIYCTARDEVPSAERTFDLLTPSLDLELTVGTEPGECATTSTIEVDHGTDVYWCYTATNSSGRPFNGHQLVDDVDEFILTDDTRYDLGPGESIDTVTLGLELTDTVTFDDFSRVGTWRLYDCDGDDCFLFDDAQASARVFLSDSETPPAPPVTDPGPGETPTPTPAPSPPAAARPVTAAPTYTG